ncbi:hypothetical protein [Flavobacterium sp.]|uniref:hypothetical protein n=1 Tax=Flavobacterium sp. TaxID=239 RepID=UPI0026270F00|nr:hypothetical protein [Flavobacterium sp.]
MKNLCSCLLVLILLNSCSDDTGTNATDNQSAVTTQPEAASTIAHRLAGEMPANSDNAYDMAGKVYNEIFYSYYDGSSLPIGLTAIRDRVNLVSNLNPRFIACKGSLYRGVQLSKVQSILNNPLTCINDILIGTGMSIPARVSLSTFTTGILSLTAKTEDYATIYDSICNYEAAVLADPLLTAKDKKVILITTSIARHSIYCAKKKPKKNTDPDWTIFIGNIIGGTYGGDNDVAEAIETALVTGIAQNQL